MTEHEYAALYPFDPSEQISQLYGIEKLRAIEDPELRRRVIQIHEAGLYARKGPVRMASRVSESDFKQRAAGEGE